MSGTPHIVSIIPARGGSKRLPRKNVLPLGGKPLIQWSIDQSQACSRIDRHVVTTDDPEITRIARKAGAETIARPAELAADTSGALETLQHAVQVLEQDGPRIDLIVLLQPTSPLRRTIDLDRALSQFEQSDADALMAVSESDLHPRWLLNVQEDRLVFPYGTSFDTQRGQEQPRHYRFNGYLYIYRRDFLLQATQMAWSDDVLPFVVPAPFDLDIDTQTDFDIAEALIHGYPYNW